jgi:hypothetical protein
MPNWKKVIVSGSDAVLNSVTASAGFFGTASWATNALTASLALRASGSLTGSLLGTSSWASNAVTASYVLNAVSASFASTSSFVTTLNQNILITGSATIGTSSLGASENTLTLGARDTANEGGQLGLNAPGGTYTSASFLDNWQNNTRILRGTNISSDATVVSWNLHTKQMQLPAYTNASSFPGTATANLAVDSGGNIITVSTTGGSVFPYTGNAVITGSLTVTQPISVPINGGMYFQGGDDAALYDVNIVNTMGIYGVQDITVGAVKLGSNGPVLYGSSSRLGIGTTTPTSASLTVNGNVWATSFTGSFTGSLVGALTGTASFADRATSSSRADTASFVTTAQTASYILQAVSASFATLAQTANTASFLPVGTYNITSSWATNTVSASFASTSSFVNPLRQNVIISGSVFVSSSILGSGSTYNTTIDLQNALILTNNTASIAYGVKYLFDDKSVRSVVWNARQLLDNSQSLSVNWDNRTLNSGSTTVLNWSSGTGSLIGTSSWAQSASNAINAQTASFLPVGTYNITSSWAVSASQAITASRATSASYALSASWAPGGGAAFPYVGNAVITGSLVVSGSTNGLDTTFGVLTRGIVNKVDWAGGVLSTSTGNNSVDWENYALIDSSANSSIDWENRILTEGTGTYVALEYSNDVYLNSQLYYRNVIPGQVQRKLAETPASYYGGQVIQATVDGAVSDFDLVFLDTDGTWKGVKATVVNGAAKMLGVCVDQAGGYVLIEGDVGVSDDNSQGAYVIGADHGLPVYVSATTGVMTVTAPSGAGELVRIVGHIYYQSTTDANWWTMKFRPSSDWVEI